MNPEELGQHIFLVVGPRDAESFNVEVWAYGREVTTLAVQVVERDGKRSVELLSCTYPQDPPEP